MLQNHRCHNIQYHLHKLLELLRDGEVGLDDLVRRSSLAGSEVISAMTMLVLKGAAEQRPGNVFAMKRRQPQQQGE